VCHFAGFKAADHARDIAWAFDLGVVGGCPGKTELTTMPFAGKIPRLVAVPVKYRTSAHQAIPRQIFVIRQTRHDSLDHVNRRYKSHIAALR
jgi:hypothetical protein